MMNNFYFVLSGSTLFFSCVSINQRENWVYGVPWVEQLMKVATKIIRQQGLELPSKTYLHFYF